MQTVQPSLFTRDDTILGVCEALGQDFGFNPLYLRAVFAALLLWNPVAVLGTYAALGLMVFASRRLYPAARKTTELPRSEAATALESQNDTEPMPLAEAA